MVPLRIFLLTLVTPALPAAIDPAGLVLNVRQEQVQQTQLNAATSDGRRDRTTKRVRLLHVECRYLGDGHDEPATLRWFFIGRNPSDGRFDYYSFGTEDIAVPRKALLQVRIVSDPLRPGKQETPNLLPSMTVPGRSEPAGWIVLVCQGNDVVKQTASTPGMLEWMNRNPPPVQKKPPNARRAGRN